jgi:hypothetical protein
MVGLGTPIRYDDFGFEVVRCEPVAVDGHTWQAVTLRVHNDAKRVSFRVKPGDVVIDGADGRRFWPSAEGRRALEWAGRALGPIDPELPAGTTADVVLVFDLPADLPRPLLKLEGGGWLGAFLDHLIVGPQAIGIGRPRTGSGEPDHGSSSAPGGG